MIENFNNEFKDLLKRFSEETLSLTEVSSFLKKIDSLQLKNEEDVIRRFYSTESYNIFNEKEKEIFNAGLTVIKNGFFGARFYNS